jgi:hypothetical protein
MNLELKHLSPYLPYNLKFYNLIVGKTLKMIGCEFTHELRIRLTDGLYAYDVCKIKPILRPLCDLQNKEHENRKVDREYIIEADADADLSYYEWCYLLENHFDVFGLIKKGLAIDINTI